jgi:hypothetical protein
LVVHLALVTCAEAVMRGVIAAYAEPNRTFDELTQRVQRGEGYDPLKEFTDACRQELSYCGSLKVCGPANRRSPCVYRKPYPGLLSEESAKLA